MAISPKLLVLAFVTVALVGCNGGGPTADSSSGNTSSQIDAHAKRKRGTKKGSAKKGQNEMP